MKQHIFLGEAWLGARTIPTHVSRGGLDGGIKVANSYALFCPKCAAIWGKLMHEHPDSYCQPLTSFCMKHAIGPSDATFTANSPWQDDPRGGEVTSWPPSVIAHDVLSLTTFYLNNPNRWYR